jgi:general secretion pathway protein H
MTLRQRISTQGGFTLIEMLVVLTIAALVVGLALPRLTGATETATLRTAAHEVAAALRTTRSLAMTRGRTEAFFLDTANGAFRAGQTASPGRLPRGLQLALVTVTADKESTSQGRIQFFADGSSTGGGVLLVTGKARSQVLVDWLTGRVSVAEVANASAH